MSKNKSKDRRQLEDLLVAAERYVIAVLRLGILFSNGDKPGLASSGAAMREEVAQARYGLLDEIEKLDQ